MIVSVENFWQSADSYLVFCLFQLLLVAHRIVAMDELPPILLKCEEVKIAIWLDNVHLVSG